LVQALSRTTEQQHSALPWRRLALAQAEAGQPNAFFLTCRQMQQRFRVPGQAAQAGFALDAPLPPIGGINVALLRHPGLPPGAGLYDRLVSVRTAVLRPGTLTNPESWLPLLPKEERLLRGAVLCRAGKDADPLKELEGLRGPVAVLFRALAEKKIDLSEQTPLPWQQRVESDVLRREVEAVLAVK
jgi:hypothetical protein